MAFIVQKYGGTSVGNPERILNVAERIVRLKKAGNHVLVVVSAMGDTTDDLISLAREVAGNPPKREMDMLLSSGERISMALLSMAINDMGVSAISFTGSQSGILTDTSHTEARILSISGTRIREALDKDKVVIVAGFQGCSHEREVTTLGRGGSDTTAVALAIALKADRCEILTDVDGVYSADPRIVKNAKKLDFCSYDEMLEMAWLGAKVLHPRSVEIAKKFDMPIVVASSFNNNPGTLIKGEDMEKAEVRAITFNREIAKVSIVEVPDIPGTAASVFELLSSAQISCSFIVQSQSHHGKNDITFTVNEKDFKSTMNLLENNMKKIGGRELISDINIATISVVGTGVVRDPRVASRVFKTLAACETNIDLISSSNITLTCVIKERDVEKAVQHLHKEFILNDETDVIE